MSDEEPLVPTEVLEAIEQLGRGETASKEDLEAALKWDVDIKDND